MATLLSGTSRNVPSILGFEMIFREDYKSLNIISNPAIGTFRDVPSSKSHHPYNSACYGVQYTVIWASIDFEFLACVYISTRPQAKLKYKCTREIRNLWMRMLWYRTTISTYYVLYKKGSLEIVSTYYDLNLLNDLHDTSSFRRLENP